MTTINERISIVRKAKNLKQSEFSVIVGVPRSTISEVENKKTKPSTDIIVGISNGFSDINIDWVLTGKGEMYKTEGNDAANETMDREAVKLLEMLNALPPAEKRDALMVLESKLSAIEQKKQLEELKAEMAALRQKVG